LAGAKLEVAEMDTREAEKAAAGRKSLDFIEDGMVVGLGTGSTAKYAIEFLGERVRNGLKIRGIPTSNGSAELARSVGIPLITLDDVDAIDVTIDGADEVGPELELIKGGGGALLHEKIVATSSKRLVIVADQQKQVEYLGRFPLPVEVIKFAASPVKRTLQALGLNPGLRAGADGKPYLTDEGNFILDCKIGRILDPPALARSLKSITGVVEHGLFLGLASMVIIAGPSGTRLMGPKISAS
jgi:ribose 5-phosphate isomerase A